MIVSIGSNFSGRRLALGIGLLMLAWAMPAGAEALSGAGSSAAAPVYKAWAKAYGRNQNFQLVYDPAGSSAGVKKIKANEVAFGASDVPPSEAELVADKLVLVPTFVTGAVPIVNLPKIGAGKLRLSGDTLVAIYSGKITRWNAAEIQSLNAGLALPDLEIKPVVRSDGSGTTYYFSDYLSKISPAFKDAFGVKTSIAWPGNFIGAKGGDGVAKIVKETIGAIGYIDFDYVGGFGLNPVQLRNGAGEFVAPGAASFRAALRASEWTGKGNFQATLTNMQANGAWPITMGTFVLLPKVSPKSDETALALRFFVWALLKGDQVTEGMSFVRLPDKMQGLAFKALSSVTDQKGRAIGLEAMSEQSKL